jgi:hypothetical protein
MRQTLIVVFVPASVSGLAVDIKAHHGRDVVLPVVHSTTIPGNLKGLGGPPVVIGDAEYDSLFVVVPSSGTVSRLRF